MLSRREGAVLFGLAFNVDVAKLVLATPKIAVLLTPTPVFDEERQPNYQHRAYSMRKLHHSLQLTGAVTLGSAACLPGTTASKLSNLTWLKSPSWALDLDGAPLEGQVCIRQRSGTMLADIMLKEYESIAAIIVYRTAQKHFEGSVIFHA